MHNEGNVITVNFSRADHDAHIYDRHIWLLVCETVAMVSRELPVHPGDEQ
jgi:hypothetical protein